MVSGSPADLLPALAEWLRADRDVHAAVLFGSQARERDAAAAADGWSDIDLHVIARAPERLERVDWARALPGQRFQLQVARPATGGVRKVTVLFAGGEADLVLVPSMTFRLAGLALACGLHGRIGFLRAALNNLSTIMGGGYRFLKGEKNWGWIYARVVAEMPGVRFNASEVRQMADIFLCDLLWVLQKLERGELVAAQRILHRSLVETNIVLLHETRMRRGSPTFQQARRVEQLATAAELSTVQLSARLEREELRVAAWQTLAGLKTLMAELDPAWTVPAGMTELLAPHTLPLA